MIKLDYVPTYANINYYYGNPESRSNKGVLRSYFVRDYLVIIKTPFPLRLSWDTSVSVQRIQVHKLIAAAVGDALAEILDYRGYEYLSDNDYDLYGGGFNFRLTRGGGNLSTHSWGVSIDMNPHLAPFRKYDEQKKKYINNQPDFIRDAFTKRGFTSFEFDGQHFQGVRSTHSMAIYNEEAQESGGTP